MAMETRTINKKKVIFNLDKIFPYSYLKIVYFSKVTNMVLNEVLMDTLMPMEFIVKLTMSPINTVSVLPFQQTNLELHQKIQLMSRWSSKNHHQVIQFTLLQLILDLHMLQLTIIQNLQVTHQDPNMEIIMQVLMVHDDTIDLFIDN